MNNLKKIFSRFSRFLRKYWPFFLIFFIVSSFFWKVIFLGRVALPADLIDLSLPYPVKNPIVSDAVSFSFPMRKLAVDYLKNGQPPLWNPLILSGTPLLANFQSAPFSPTNIVYLFGDFINGWNIQVILQHILAAIFTYILLRYWKVSKSGSIFGGLAFAFGGFNLIWSQWNAHSLTAAFIPLIILFADKLINRQSILGGIGLSIALALQIFSGYPQIVLYTIIALFIFLLFNFSLRKLILLCFCIILGLGISAAQVLPGYELLKLSQRETEPIPLEWAFLSSKQLITFIAPDYFGNHSTGNFWGPKNYTSTIGFMGVTAICLSIVSLKNTRAKKIKFLVALVLLSLFLSFANPISVFLWEQNIFGMQAGASYRILALFNLGVALLAGFGIDNLKASSRFRIAPLVVVFLTLFLFVLHSLSLRELMIGGVNAADISLRNLILPFLVLIGVVFSFLTERFIPRLVVFILGFLFLTEVFYFGWKFTPFPPKELVFPGNEITRFLSTQKKPFRVLGGAEMNVNYNMVYGIEFPTGYDALYPATMAKFLGVLNSSDPSASAQDRYGLITNELSPLVDLLNTKYFLKDQKVIFNKSVLPRSFMVYDWEVIEDDKEILNRLVNPTFPYRKKIILNENPKFQRPKKIPNGIVNYLNYNGQESNIEVETPENGMLFISDTYYPGWKVYVDGVEAKIFRADYVFRAVEIPKGKHQIKMTYISGTFYNGLKISLVSITLLIVIFLFRKTILGLTHE